MWTMIGLAWLVMVVVMLVLWYVQRRTHNAGIVDVAWSFGTGLTGVGFALLADGAWERRVLIAVMAGVWGLRLGWHLWKRMLREEEDGRYRALREKWGDNTQRNLFWFFQIQAAWAVLFALPMLAAATNPSPAPAWYDLLAVGVWLIAIAGESLADWQLARFKQQPDSRGKVCRVGLWRYSRHPNYFFEWLQWWAYLLMGLGSPVWYLAVAGPFVMLYFLMRVTGIPVTEAHALRSRGEAYRNYQQTTSAFFPWLPKEST